LYFLHLLLLLISSLLKTFFIGTLDVFYIFWRLSVNTDIISEKVLYEKSKFYQHALEGHKKQQQQSNLES
jgi:hypothetical protein